VRRRVEKKIKQVTMDMENSPCNDIRIVVFQHIPIVYRDN
jgi:hypothetical protein